MKRLLSLIVCSATATAFLGQDIEPEEPGIELPPTLLEVEDLQVEDITALIPDDEPQLQPVIDIPLPEADDIYLPEEKFDIPYPDQVTAGPATASLRAAPNIDIFSDGQIGVGSVNHVRGDLSLYRLGPDPKFNLRFLHDKLDGYGFRGVGAGFYHSDDILEGDLSFLPGSAKLGFEAQIYESSNGLQQQSTQYEALTHRRISGGASTRYRINDNLAVFGDANVEYSQQILAATSPETSYELAIVPNIGLDFQFDLMSFGGAISYELRSVPAVTNSFSAFATFRLLAIEELLLGANLNLFWYDFSRFYVPFSLVADGYVGDFLQYFTEIGYRADRARFSELWQLFPFIDLSPARLPEHGWFWSGYIQARFIRTMLLQFDFDFRYLYEGYVAGDAVSADTGLFPYSYQADYLVLDLGLSYDWEVNSYWGFTFSVNSWIQGGLFQRHSIYPLVELAAGVRLHDARQSIGGELSISTDITDTLSVPEIQLSGFYRLSERIMFKLDVVDPLAPLTTRLFWEPFEAPGFHVFLSTTISL